MKTNLLTLFSQIEYWYNRILVYDGSDDGSMLIGELFGTPNHKIVKSISSSQKSIYIDFKKQYDDGTVEFLTSIKYNKIIPDCQFWLHDNILLSPNNPNINCSWIISIKYGSYITIDFNFIEVKQMNTRAKPNRNSLRFFKIA